MAVCPIMLWTVPQNEAAALAPLTPWYTLLSVTDYLAYLSNYETMYLLLVLIPYKSYFHQNQLLFFILGYSHLFFHRILKLFYSTENESAAFLNGTAINLCINPEIYLSIYPSLIYPNRFLFFSNWLYSLCYISFTSLFCNYQLVLLNFSTFSPSPPIPLPWGTISFFCYLWVRFHFIRSFILFFRFHM